MKLEYKWFRLNKYLHEDRYEIVKNIGSVKSLLTLGYIEKYREKWVFSSDASTIIWYDDCLQDVVNILKELNK